jgi:hypothetical protein
MEVVAALGVLMTAMVVVAEVGFWSLVERQRTATRQEAIEAAANVLEVARAQPWPALTPAWAAGQHLAGPLDQRLTAGKLEARVEPEPGRPLTKRVTVKISWEITQGNPARPVELVGLLSARSPQPGGGKP